MPKPRQDAMQNLSDSDFLDADVVSRLRMDLGGPELDALARLYAERTRSLVNRLRTAVEQHEDETVKELARNLRACSTSLGASRLIALCRELEGPAVNTPRRRGAEVLARLESVFEATHAQLDEHVGPSRA
jgi:HPt (histidine-containing phosphotransfer) domain-containing protein